MILALDLATTTGWACGVPGGPQLANGTVRFAAPGACHEAVFAGAVRWMNNMCDREPTTVVYEAPLATSMMRGRTTTSVTTVLYGLPAVIGAVAYPPRSERRPGVLQPRCRLQHQGGLRSRHRGLRSGYAPAARITDCLEQSWTRLFG